MEQQQLSGFGNSTEELNKQKSIGKQLVTREAIKNTPFHLVFLDNELGFIGFGMYKLTEPKFKNMKEVTMYLKINIFEIVNAMVMATFDIKDKIKGE